MDKIILVVEASFLGVDYIAQAIRNLGYVPLFLTNYSNQEGDALISLAKERAILCNTTDVDELEKVILALGRENIIGMTTFLDSRLAIVAEVNRKLDLAGVSESVLKLKEKSYVNNIIKEFVPASIAIEWGVTPAEQIHDFLANSNLKKFIAKPSFTAGAIGTFIFTDFADLAKNIVQATDIIPSYLKPNHYVLQEFIEGDLVSVEGYTYQNKIEFIGATKRFKFENTEVGHEFPYQAQMPVAYQKCQKIIEVLLQRSDYKYGFFHIEFIIDGDEVRLIDANMGRPGGTNVMEVMAFAYQINTVKLFELAISIAVFQTATIENSFFTSEKCQPVSGVLYGQRQAARLLRFHLPEAKSSHHLAVNMGALVPALGESNWSIIGTLTGKPEDVLHDLKNITLITEQGECGAVIA